MNLNVKYQSNLAALGRTPCGRCVFEWIRVRSPHIACGAGSVRTLSVVLHPW